MALAIMLFYLPLGLAIYLLSLTIYRIRFSPLRRFPGPVLAKASLWYQFYYDWVKPGMYYQRIQAMHQKYGPVVQVGPDEIHIADPAYFNTVYVPAGSRKSEMHDGPFRGTPFEDHIELLRTHEGHRFLRAPIQNYFLRGNSRAAEPHVLDTVRTLMSRLEASKDTGRPVNLSYALLSFAVDSVSASICEAPTRFETQRTGMRLVPLLAILPGPVRSVTMRFLKVLASVMPATRAYERQTNIYKPAFKEALEPSPIVTFGLGERAVLPKACFGHDVYDLGGQLIQQAGLNPMASCLQTIVTHLGLDEARRDRLRTELELNTLKPSASVPWRALEQLPYLDACLKEGLRLGTGNMYRAARMFPETDLVVEGWTIPRGTAVPMTQRFMHTDAEAFPEPERFIPERWLEGDDKTRKRKNEYLVPFGRGSRDCLGKYQARMTMLHALHALYRPGAPELELYETGESDVALVHGYMFPLPRLESKGVRVLVKA